MTAPVGIEGSRGCLEMRGRVTREQLRRAIELAHYVWLPKDRVMLDFWVTHFVVDGVEVANPLGMECDRLEACAEITTGDAE